jgi:hypothetical protein
MVAAGGEREKHLLTPGWALEEVEEERGKYLLC